MSVDLQQTLEMFLTLAGIFSRNMALTCLPDTIYLVGNIFRIIFDIIPAEKFLQGFQGTNQHSAMLKAMPVTLIRDTQVGLKGAVAYARHRERPARNRAVSGPTDRQGR